MTGLKKRIQRLEANIPEDIVLYLKDGREYRHPGPPLDFFMQGMNDLARGEGALLDALKQTIRAKGCGRLHELLRALL